jgi:4-hydroxy-L-threonine phosphate dehydrogenase PdxA
VDHGTAFDIAGKNLANEESLLDALDMAVRFCMNVNGGELLPQQNYKRV